MRIRNREKKNFGLFRVSAGTDFEPPPGLIPVEGHDENLALQVVRGLLEERVDGPVEGDSGRGGH